jgi:hypothetical protein
MVPLAQPKLLEAALLASLKLGGHVFEATAGAALKTLSVKDIEAGSFSCKRQLKTLLLSVLCGGITVDLPDSRDQALPPGATPFGPHKVSRFFVPAGKGTVEQQVRELLAEEEVKSLAAHFNLEGALPRLSELAYFWNSHDKARNRGYADLGDKTTQKEDFDATGYAFGDDRLAVRFCAGLVRRARDLQLDLTKGPDHWANSQAEKFNQFSEGEREILKQLRTGEIRTFSGALVLDGDGRLRANTFSTTGARTSGLLARRPPRNQQIR